MGIRAAHGRPLAEIERAREKRKEKENAEEFESSKKEHVRRRDEHTESVLDAEVDTTYRPSSAESIAAYELIMKFIETKFGAQRTAIMRSFAHELIAILKNDTLTASQSRINALNSTFSSASVSFHKNDLDLLQKYCRKINDFGIAVMDPDEKAARENNRGFLSICSFLHFSHFSTLHFDWKFTPFFCLLLCHCNLTGNTLISLRYEHVL